MCINSKSELSLLKRVELYPFLSCFDADYKSQYEIYTAIDVVEPIGATIEIKDTPLLDCLGIFTADQLSLWNSCKDTVSFDNFCLMMKYVSIQLQFTFLQLFTFLEYLTCL